jgi:hypothetical protein
MMNDVPIDASVLVVVVAIEQRAPLLQLRARAQHPHQVVVVAIPHYQQM